MIKLVDIEDDVQKHNHRRNFYESWIVESPQRIYPRNDFNAILNNLTGYMDTYPSKEIAINLYILEGSRIVFVFYRLNNEIIAIVELEKKSESIKVTNVAKKEEYKWKPPYMDKIYEIILSIANNKSLTFMSDDMLTDGGLSIWKQLIQNGHTVSVYNVEKSGQSMTVLTNISQLQQYIDDTMQSRKYRFVLSENYEKWFGYVYEVFSRRRVMELSLPPYDFDQLNGIY
jgi:hypothetical protein